MQIVLGDNMKIVKRKIGFTLVELLVVISIIAILLAVLMPSLSRARMQAAFATDGSKLKNFHIAYMLYAQDNNNKSVPSVNWGTGTYDRGTGVITKKEDNIRRVIDSYINRDKNKALWECPADRGSFKIYKMPTYSSYSYNWYILCRNKTATEPWDDNAGDDVDAVPCNLMIFDQPAKTTLFGHQWVWDGSAVNNDENYRNGIGWYYPHKFQKDKASRGYYSIYLDGHCKQSLWREYQEENEQMRKYYYRKGLWRIW
jgi:prepilin-type N-terminal cleavage/methylation domain-containing protein